MVWPIIGCVPDPEQTDTAERLPRAEDYVTSEPVITFEQSRAETLAGTR